MAKMVPILLSFGKVILPDWADRILIVAGKVYDGWEEIELAAKDGWGAEDDRAVSDVVTEALSGFPVAPEGGQPGDSRKLGDAMAVIVRWIALTPKKVHRPFVNLQAKREARKALLKSRP